MKGKVILFLPFLTLAFRVTKYLLRSDQNFPKNALNQFAFQYKMSMNTPKNKK